MTNMIQVTIWRPLCPHCGLDSGVSLEGRFNSQPKNDAMYGCRCRACDKNFHINWDNDTKTLVLEKTKTSNAIPIFILVSLMTVDNGVQKPLYLVVRDARYGNPEVAIDHQEEWEHKRYFYEEHTCPTNYVRIERFLIDNDDDPHGIFTFHDFVDVKDAVYEDVNQHRIDVKATWPHVFANEVINGETRVVASPLALKGA